MRKFKLYAAFLVVFAVVFTSCSKDEVIGADGNLEKATLSFGAIVNDLVSNRAPSKQSVGNMPECSDDDPAYIRIVLMEGDTEVVGTSDNPYRVNLATGQAFTVEDPALELDPGTYSLEHFSVYNEEGDLIWLAPRGGELANYVENPLPLSIDLGAGVKKYVDVPVLCFDNRDVNEYGYLFFELDTNQAVEFCFFANFCNDEGRHFTANYTVNVWKGTDNTGTLLHNNLQPTTGIDENGDFFASPVCVALPYNSDPNEDYLYYEVTLLGWEANYGDVSQQTISGTLSRNDIEANFGAGDEVEYEHLRFGCDDEGEEAYITEMEEAIMNMFEDMEAVQMTGDPDVDFAKLQIEHHEGAIALANIELEHGHHAEARSIAEETRANNLASKERLEDFLENHGTPTPIENAEEYFAEFEAVIAQMKEEIIAVAYTGDPDYDFARKMIPHHLGGIALSLVELEYGVHEMTREEARLLIEVQRVGIAKLEAFIEEHGNPIE